MIVESAYGQGIADVFIIAIPLAVLSLIAIALLPNKQLSTQTAAEKLEEEAEQVAIDIAEAEIGAPVTSSITLVEGADGEAGRETGGERDDEHTADRAPAATSGSGR